MTYGVYDIRDFGALGDGVADDTLPIQDAIDAAEALRTGGAVLIPPGEYYSAGPKMSTQVTLMGFGPSSILRQLPGLTTPFVTLKNGLVNHTNLRDLRLHGNLGNQGGGPTAHGIFYHTNEEADKVRPAEFYRMHGDAQHRIINVTVDGFTGDAANLFTREVQVIGCHFSHCKGYGLVCQGSDGWCHHTTINWMGRSGVLTTGGGWSFVGVKCWYIGTEPQFDNSDGFQFNASGHRVAACEAQDVSRYGLFINGSDSHSISGFTVKDTGNWHMRTQIGFAQPVLPAAVYMASSGGANRVEGNKLDFTYSSRAPVDKKNIRAFLHFGNGCAGNQVSFTGNLVNILGESAITRPSGEGAIHTDNLVIFNNRIV